MNRTGAVQAALLAAWLGAATLVATAVAPAAFRVLPTRTLAGALVGQVLPVIFFSGLAVAVVVGLMDRRAPVMVRGRVMTFGLLAMLFGCAAAQFMVAPKIDALRESITGPVDALDSADPRRVSFGRLHGISVALMGAAMVGAGASLLSKISSKPS